MANRLLISAAGSGKTTLLVNEALALNDKKVLLLTYTEANEAEIRKCIVQASGAIPERITVQTWYAFLLQHGVRPFQSALDDSLHDARIGFYLNSGKSGQRFDASGNPILLQGKYPIYWGEEDFLKHYFTSDLKIYADKISKFVVAANKSSEKSVVERIEAIFDHIFIDEVQDLAGYDLEVIGLLMRSRVDLTMAGDPRQVTYLTHNPDKHKKYANGGIARFIRDKIPSNVDRTIDETTLTTSHRNHGAISEYANRLYPGFPPSASCECGPCHPSISHVGMFAVQPSDLPGYLQRFSPVQLRWSSQTETQPGHAVKNMGESKGSTIDRGVILPTTEMTKWFWNNAAHLSDITRAKLYVAVTRSRFSSAVVIECPGNIPPDGLELFVPDA